MGFYITATICILLSTLTGTMVLTYGGNYGTALIVSGLAMIAAAMGFHAEDWK
jgi:hypothetical protein